MPVLTPAELWRSIRQGKWIQVLAIYAGASFVVLEAVGLLTEQLGLPDWVFPGAVVLLLLGLPIILATAFVQNVQFSAPPSVSAGGSVPADEPPAETTATDVAAVAKHWLTWRKAIMGGVLAFALLGVSVSGYMAMRVMGIGPIGSLVAAGVVEVGEPIILADFDNNTSDSILAVVATEAFRIDLAQSALVSIMTLEELAGALARMEKESDEPVDRTLARELAIREGIKAVIVGEIGTLGDSYVVTVELLSADTGETIAAFRETADGTGEIMSSVDKLSKKLRERLGESLRTIRRNEPLDRVTTSSLEALYKYSQAVRALDVEGNHRKGITLLGEAIAIDSTFAMAYLALGTNLFGTEPARAVDALTRAFEHRDRLTDRERYLTMGTYYELAYYDVEKALTAYETLVDNYPNDNRGLLGLASMYMEFRDWERAEQLLRRGAAADSTTAVCYPCLIGTLITLGKYEDAEAMIQSFAANVPNNPSVWFARARLDAARGDYERAAASMLELREIRSGSLGLRAATGEWLAAFSATQGKLASAERHLREAMAANHERDLPAEYLESASALAFLHANVRGDGDRALREIDAALERYPLESIAPLDRPYTRLGPLYASAGDPERARALMTEYQAEVRPELRRWEDPFIQGALGLAALAAGDTDEAVARIRDFDERSGSCQICALPQLGRAYDAAGQADSAIAVYERYLSTGFAVKFFWDAYNLAHIYGRLGALYEARGENEKATYYYGRLIDLWKDADPELQPRVDAARRAIAALSSDR